MNRLFIIIGLHIILAAVFNSASADDTDTPGARPNIVFIFADDAGYADFGFHGSEVMQTPRLDQLAAESTRFSQAYVTAAVCGPSRAGLLTGKYQQRFGYEENNVGGYMSQSGTTGDDMGLPLDELTLADRLKEQGFRTMLIGKWHMGNADRFHPTKRGFDEFYGIRGGARSYWKFTAEEADAQPENRLERGFERYVETDKYLTDALADEASAFIERNAGRPFFLMLSYNAVHTPMQARPEDLAQFPELEGTRQTLAAMTLAMDRATGRVLDTLERLGLAENTLVVFSNDNGGPSDTNDSRNDPLSGTKANHLEGGIRVPFLMRWPGVIEAGDVYDNPVSTLDLLPTFLAAAGGDPAGIPELDGVDLLPYLQGENSERPHPVLYWKKENRGAIRDGDWKLLRYPDRPAELYDLSTDVSEVRNLASRHPEKVRAMYKQLFEWELGLERPRWQLLRLYEGKAMERMDNWREPMETVGVDRAFPDRVVHEAGPGPVKIVNIFPEHGLTDPHFMIAGDRLYLGMGHDQSWDVEFDWTMDRWEIWSTDDLKTWVKETTIHPDDTYFGPEPNCWAGDFAQKDGKYYWYFSNRSYDTGVMVADQPGGPYRDALGKPLLPNGLTPTKSYDPEVFEEDGVYTIVFGAGTYYAATLADDMVSLADEPELIVVNNPDGSQRFTDDKPTLFKRDGQYYLVWGAHYAMSDKLRGPYEYKGAFYAGGHGSVFNWKGQWYVVHEHHDISMFYRGIMLKPLYFNADGTVDLEHDFGFPPGGGRLWDFDNSRMGWRSATGTQVEWTGQGTVTGRLSGRSIIESANWASTDTAGRSLHINIRNGTAASKLKLSFAEFVSDRERFWSYPSINWLEEAAIEIDVVPDSTEFRSYRIDLDEVENMPAVLKRLRIEFLDADSGAWEIDHIRIQ